MGCRLRGWPAGVSLVALLGCNAYDPDLLEELPGSSVGNVDRIDAALPCSRKTEACNAEDDDCDGEVDEGAERDCLFPQATSVCVTSGDCVIVECASGYADCNRELADGCEQRADQIACGECGKVCADPDEGPTRGNSSRPDDDRNTDEEDAGAGPPPPACVPTAERCDDLDNDCDDRTDEGTVCAVAMCMSTTPSYRGTACDQCVCQSCAPLVALCQNHPDATWAAQCRDLVECVVIHSRAGDCPSADCYQAGNGPCAEETRIAAGASSTTDAAQIAAGCAGGTSPPPAACAAAVNYRDQCTTTVCSAVCSQ